VSVLVLASSSPRRQEILKRAGIPFLVRPADIDETLREGELPAAYVRRLAQAKAESVPADSEEIVLAADTVVVVDGLILGKPAGGADAARMLRLLSGREHQVLTGVCLRAQARSVVDEESTRVWFVPLTEDQIADYVSSGEPLDKAGAYAIQGLASKFIPRIEGCYFNVVGLPIAKVFGCLERLSPHVCPGSAP
jgi:septum formation protein